MRLTHNEIKLVIFILTALVVGALVKEYRVTHRATMTPAPASARAPKL
jgi:hypothetical protein